MSEIATATPREKPGNKSMKANVCPNPPIHNPKLALVIAPITL